MQNIDQFLNGITMYRLMLYFLISLFVVALVYSFLGVISFSSVSLVLSAVIFVSFCWVANRLFAIIFRVPTNVESVYISAFILTLIVAPIKDFSELPFFIAVAFLAMGSKYILAINKKHILNPVIAALVITSFLSMGSATWWIGVPLMTPFVLLGGLLIVRKIKRFELLFSFLFASFITITFFNILGSGDLLKVISGTFTNSAILFFAFVMLTEPLTTPPKKIMQLAYGVVVGILYAPQIHVGDFYSTPEIALFLGNIFSYIVSPKGKFILILKESIKMSSDIYEFVFVPKKFSFIPGQFMEWTLSYKKPDSRGNRRYFTIASSPTEGDVRIGMRFYEDPSGFKKALVAMSPGDEVMVGQLSGDFVLPEDVSRKLVFIAGGIGITPFRSIVKYLIDKNEKRDIVVLYVNKKEEDIVFKDIFQQANQQLGIRIINILTEITPPLWRGETGHLSKEMIEKNIPDFNQRIFYISGSHTVVTSSEAVLKELGIKRKNIQTDYFPGY